MTPHYLRVARTLAMLSLPIAGCSTRTLDQATGPTGTCVDSASTKFISCTAGQTCGWDGTTVVCREPSETGAACGNITCDPVFCACSPSAQSTCECNGVVVGPLPPPDLPDA
jgi:hypothetical protein